MGWIPTDVNVFGQNMAMVFAAGSTLIFYLSSILKRRGDKNWVDAVRMMGGVCLVAAALGLHRVYWGAWRAHKAAGDIEGALWYVDHAYYLTSVVFVVLLGYTLHNKPFLANIFGKYWLAAGVGMGLGVWITSSGLLWLFTQ